MCMHQRMMVRPGAGQMKPQLFLDIRNLAVDGTSVETFGFPLIIRLDSLPD